MSLPYEDDGPTRIVGAIELSDADVMPEEEEPESLDPAKLFTDSVMGPRNAFAVQQPPTPPQSLDVVYLSAPPRPEVVIPTRAPRPEPRRRPGLAMSHFIGAGVVLATIATTASLLYIYFH